MAKGKTTRLLKHVDSAWCVDTVAAGGWQLCVLEGGDGSRRRKTKLPGPRNLVTCLNVAGDDKVVRGPGLVLKPAGVRFYLVPEKLDVASSVFSPSF